MAKDWMKRCYTYGSDNSVVDGLIRSFPIGDIDVEIKEILKNGKGDKLVVERHFKDITHFRDYLCVESSESSLLRAVSINRLTGDLARLIGAKYDMDYEIWTSRVHSSDREYFMAPLNEKGPRQFSHFHLSSVDFYAPTNKTPTEFLRGKRINRTVRIMKFLDRLQKQQRMYVIRRAAGYLQREKDQWTFLYFGQPFQHFERTGFVSDIPGESMAPMADWLKNALSKDSPQEHLSRLAEDGFGLVVKILRDIKSSWKLLLSDMEEFLEDLNEGFGDEQLMSAASYLHRQFLLNLDIFQRDLFYHRRYVGYLIQHKDNLERFIVPTMFLQDLQQEEGALVVLDSRLKAIRVRTTTVLEMVLNITSIEQARLSSDILKLQRTDAKVAFQQGESIKRLTLLNMFYLPPSFVAAAYGMNTTMTQGTQLWGFVLIAIFLTGITMFFANFKLESCLKTWMRPIGWIKPKPRKELLS